MRVLILGVFILFTAASCVAPGGDSIDDVSDQAETQGEGQSIEEARQEAWAKIDQEACKDNGGVVRQAGLLGFPRCILPYADAGNICTDGGECEGKCLNKDDVTDYDGAPGTQKGVCQSNDNPFGCYSEIENGTATPFLCVD